MELMIFIDLSDFWVEMESIIFINLIQYINLSDFYRMERLGRNGIDEIKTHQFFRNTDWTWDTLRQGNHGNM